MFFQVNEVSKRGWLPVVVGGTMYYVQILLWESMISKMQENHKPKKLCPEHTLVSLESVQLLSIVKQE